MWFIKVCCMNKECLKVIKVKMNKEDSKLNLYVNKVYCEEHK